MVSSLIEADTIGGSVRKRGSLVSAVAMTFLILITALPYLYNTSVLQVRTTHTIDMHMTKQAEFGKPVQRDAYAA